MLNSSPHDYELAGYARTAVWPNAARGARSPYAQHGIDNNRKIAASHRPHAIQQRAADRSQRLACPTTSAHCSHQLLGVSEVLGGRGRCRLPAAAAVSVCGLSVGAVRVRASRRDEGRLWGHANVLHPGAQVAGQVLHAGGPQGRRGLARRAPRDRRCDTVFAPPRPDLSAHQSRRRPTRDRQANAAQAWRCWSATTRS